MQPYTSLAIDHPDNLLFGNAPHPLTTRRGMVLGGGTVYPEINFTLPTMAVEASTMERVREHYQQAIEAIVLRAAELEVPGLVVEFETLPPMTENPDWGMDLVHILLEAMEQAHVRHQLPSVLRMTPNDNREFDRPPILRSGMYLDRMLELFDRAAAAGAELLSIESVGGKEIHDEALTMGDLPLSIFSLCVLGERDMRFLWSHIDRIARSRNVHAAGDSACGFGNTAMVMAEQKMIPRVFAAVVRAVTAVRSLAAHACGAVGPGKDCAYENIILKAITGFPMAAEGKSASCAHLSPVGNVAAAACDTWSNESVQHLRLLGAMAPVCSLETLAYDCRLMNQAHRDGDASARMLRNWMVQGDIGLDPQAWILSPESAIRLARTIVAAPNAYQAGRAVALEAITILRDAHDAGALKIHEREVPWLDMMQDAVAMMPEQESAFIDQIMPQLDATRWLPAEYGLA